MKEKKHSDKDLKKYLSFSITIARKAGKIIKENFSLGMKKQWKTKTSPVTATDIAIDKMVSQAIKKTFPKHDYLGEESIKTGNDDYLWICDPVDGTIPFSHGIPTSVFMLALTYQGKPIMSVIYDPYLDRMFYASKGKGAFLNGKKIRVSNRKDFASTAFAVMFYAAAKYDLLPTYNAIDLQHGTETTVGSIGYLDMLVACGEIGVVVFAGSEEWDSAAPDILVKESGGVFTDLYGEEIDYRKKVRGHIACNKNLYDKVLKIVNATIIERK